MKPERTKSSEWWRGTATHMWRTYFKFEQDTLDWEHLSEPDRRIYAVCNHIFLHRFVATDQGILRMYFTSRWGDDRYAVEDYSSRTGIPTSVIWMVVKRANRIVMEETGFLEKRGDDKDE